LNLPITPITDLKIHKGDLIASTSGRAFWILDDIGLLRQYKKDSAPFTIYQPEDTYLVNAYSELNQSNPDFNGTNKLNGVNPATGVVLYYQLPELPATDKIELEIRDADGKIVRRFSSKPDSLYKKYDGAPRRDPLLSKSAGINRFVWDLRYSTIPGVPGVYIESSYAGHVATPGKYSVTLKWGGKQVSTEAAILSNPLYETTPADYAAYNALMSRMENEVTDMHKRINTLYDKQKQLEEVIPAIPADAKYDAVRKQGDTLLKQMKAWDEDMVQRKSKAYDDVENFPNKFTANYMFLMNQTESSIPRVNQPNLDRLAELNREWSGLKAKSDDLMNNQIPAFNKMLWDAGIGPIWKK
jgi:hypothetical protein